MDPESQGLVPLLLICFGGRTVLSATDDAPAAAKQTNIAQKSAFIGVRSLLDGPSCREARKCGI